MKRSLCLLLALLLLGCASEFAPLDTAAYPAAPVEGDPYVRDASLPLEKRRYLMERLGLTENERTWTEPGLSGTFPIIVPDVLTMPVYRVSQLRFTEEHIQYLVETCFPDGVVSDIKDVTFDTLSREELRRLIASYEARLSSYTDDTPEEVAHLAAQRENEKAQLEAYKARLADAPETIERPPIDYAFDPEEPYYGEPLSHGEVLKSYLQSKWLMDIPCLDTPVALIVQNVIPVDLEIHYDTKEVIRNGETVIEEGWRGAYYSSMVMYHAGDELGASGIFKGRAESVLAYLDRDEMPEGCLMETSPKEAAETVNAFLHSAHIPASFGRFDLGSSPGGTRQEYIVYCHPLVDNIPVVSVMNRSPLVAPPNGEPHQPVEDEGWTHTTLHFLVTDRGVRSMLWNCPLQTGEQLEADAALLPYAEVEAVAKATLSGDCPEGIVPLSASLVLRAINDPTLLREGLLRPAWCFVYRPLSASEDVRYTLSIDAVTGEPIDFGRDLCDVPVEELPFLQ